mgnify:CR=1 FL=1
MSRYHVGEAWGTWQCLKVPYFGFSVISALDALARLGYTAQDPKISSALRYVLSRQPDDGRWPLDDDWPTSPIFFGPTEQPNKWVTLDALRVVKRLVSQSREEARTISEACSPTCPYTASRRRQL